MKAAPKLLRDARRRAGLSQAELARRAGVPRSVVNAYERSSREPGVDTLEAILRAAGFRLGLEPTIDLERNARILSQVLDLAASLPYRPKPRLISPPFKDRIAG